MTQQSEQSLQPPVVDPYLVPEVFCDGQFNVHSMGPLAVLTFTNQRPKPAPLFAGTMDFEAVVRARIVTTVDNLIALRDLLNRIIQEPGATMPAAGGQKLN